MLTIDNTLKELCGSRNEMINGRNINRRREYIVQTLNSILPNNIILDTYAVDATDDRINIIAPVIASNASSESIFLIAHYDVANNRADNCLDNSASIVNILHLISLIVNNPPKELTRSLYVCFTDGEEKGGKGASALAKRMLTGEFGNVQLAINLEWSGNGYIIAVEETELRPISSQLMQSLGADIIPMLYNDSVALRSGGIHSFCLALAVQKNNDIFFKHLDVMHTTNDTYSLANIDDMERFVYKLKASVYKML